MIKAVLFDVGGTLIKPEPSIGHIYSRVARRHGLKISPPLLNTLFRKAWKSRSHGPDLIDQSWWESLVGEVFMRFDPRDFSSLFRDLYKEFSKPSSWKTFPDVFPVLRALQKRHMIVGVASNWDDRLPKLLGELGLSSYLNHQFVSCHLKAMKPDQKFFQKILGVLKLPPHQVCHVGDDRFKDYMGAKRVGFKAYLIQRNRKKRNKMHIKSLAELLTHL